jgi:hypothetical protein
VLSINAQTNKNADKESNIFFNFKKEEFIYKISAPFI